MTAEAFPRNMTRYVAFLRGINLGKRRLAMTRLKELFEELELTNVNTFIASGNVLFSTDIPESDRLHTMIEKHLEASLGYGVETFVRRTDQVFAIAREKIFREDGEDGITIHVGGTRVLLAMSNTRFGLENLAVGRDKRAALAGLDDAEHKYDPETHCAFRRLTGRGKRGVESCCGTIAPGTSS